MGFDRLPAELVEEISEHLAVSYSLESLAALNATSKWLRGVTLRILYRTVILFKRRPDGRNALQEWEGAEQSLPEGCQYTR